MNTKILVCCHKRDICATHEPFMPIHVGKELHSEVCLGIQTDNIGDNISYKNASYCELTGLYWAWKNLKDVDVIGLCHYRRYFDFYNLCKPLAPYVQIPSSSFGSVNLSIPADILYKVKEGYIIVPRKKNYRMPLYLEYCYSHISDDFRVLKEIFDNEPENYQNAFNELMYNNNKLMHYNMFIMKWNEFDKYCEWLFGILSKFEQKTDISRYNAVQGRIYGYVAERLFNIYVFANNKKTIARPIIWFNDNPDPISKMSYAKLFLRNTFNNIACYLTKYHTSRFKQ